MARYSLPGDEAFPEGITEGEGNTFFVGSMGDATIYRGNTTTGQVEAFLPPDGDGRTTITGLAVDSHGRLIACDYDSGQLFVYDLGTRSLVARRSLPARESWPNDVVVAGDSAYVTDTRHPMVWRLPVGADGVGEPELAIDLTPFGPADPAYLNGIVAHPDGTVLLVASQGEGGTLWRVDLAHRAAVPVDLGGYEFNADGMLLDGDVLYGVTNRGTTIEDTRFMISAARLAPGWRSGTIVGEMSDPGWDCPTTREGGQDTARGLFAGPGNAYQDPTAPALRNRHHRPAALAVTARQPRFAVAHPRRRHGRAARLGPGNCGARQFLGSRSFRYTTRVLSPGLGSARV